MTSSDLQQLINRAGPRNDVIIPAGTHLLASTIFPLVGQTLRSQSRLGTLLRKSPSANGPIIEVNVDDVTIRGLDLDGAYPALGSGIYAHDVQNFTVRDCRISSTETSGIVMTNTAHSRILRNQLTNCGHGNVSGSPAIFGNFHCLDHVVEQNVISMTPDDSPHGIAYHTEGVGARIRQVRILDNAITNVGGGYCIEVGSFAAGGGDPERPTDVLIFNNVTSQSRNCSGGISFDWVKDAIIRGNVHRATGGTANAGIESVNGRNIRIESNQVYGGGLVSIGIACDHDGIGVEVLNNYLSNMLQTSQGNYIAFRAQAAFVSGIARFQDVEILGNEIDAPSGGDAAGIRILLEDATQVLDNIRIEDNEVRWGATGTSNSTGIALGSVLANPNMTNSAVLDNLIVNTHFGGYFQGFGATRPSYGLNQMSGVAVDYHID